MPTALFLFVAMQDTDMRWMARVGVVRAYTPGERLIYRDELLNGLLIILSGSADVEVVGRTLTRRAGECLGEVSLVDTRPASATVTAVEPTRALWLDGNVLRRRFEVDPGFAARCFRGLAILLANRLREAEATAIPEQMDDALLLDETMMDGIARAGERFRLLLSYTSAEASP
jgi:CRP/FNR family transcriptional regulator, cyclic AMP receptor protein